MITIVLVLVLLALVFTIANALGKLAAWPAILMLVLLHLLAGYQLR
jgi:hypothetical protein